MSNPLVSVIIPIYNGAKYIPSIRKCMNAQTYKNIEIVIIDDGSSDSTYSSLCELSEEDSKYIIKTQNNQGPSAARNVGIDYSKGEFIFFCDADDTIPANSIEILVKKIIENNIDVVLGTFNSKGIESEQEVFLNSDDMMEFAINQFGFIEKKKLPSFTKRINPGSQCMKLIKKSLIIENNIRFCEEVNTHHEDTIFSMRLYQKCGKVLLIDHCTYYYDINVPGSNRKKFHANKLEETIVLLKTMKPIINNEKIYSLFVQEIVYECWSDYFTHIDNEMNIDITYDQLKRFICNDNIYPFLENINVYSGYYRLILNTMYKKRWLLLSIYSVIWKIKKRILT